MNQQANILSSTIPISCRLSLFASKHPTSSLNANMKLSVLVLGSLMAISASAKSTYRISLYSKTDFQGDQATFTEEYDKSFHLSNLAAFLPFDADR